MPRRQAPRRRWDVSQSERERIHAIQSESPTLVGVGKMLARSPSLIPEVLRSTLEGAVQGIYGHGGLVWLLDSERVRQVVPDAASGVSWADERLFVEPLVPRLRSDMRVLEIGCGGGRIARHVAPHVRELVCGDVSKTMIREARGNLSAYSNVRFVRTRGFTLDGFEDETFDLAYAQGVFSYFELAPALALLAEVRRVLVAGGTFVVNFFTIDGGARAKQATQQALRGARRGRFSGSVPRPYATAQVEAMLAAAGLEVVDRVEAGEGDEELPSVFVVERPPSPGRTS